MQYSLLLPILATLAGPLPGFTPSPHFDEQTRDERFDDSVSVHLNAPGDFDPARPTLLVLYALPNGNTIAQTIGRQRAEGRDWHYYIQHIGAQVRWLRAESAGAATSQPAGRNLVVGYLEADGRSWPAWRRTREDSGSKIGKLIDGLRRRFGAQTTVALACHSGGGAFVLDYLDHVPEIPAWIERIVFLDANYSYDSDRHAAKLTAWLRSDETHHLGVYAYDDRDVTFNDKPIVSATGGTWRATGRMLDGLAALDFAGTETETWRRATALDGRAELIRLKNPERKILHTVMVERNGLIHGLRFPRSPVGFWSAAVYGAWVQP